MCSLKSGQCLWRQSAPKTDGWDTLFLDVGRCLVKSQGTWHLSTAEEKFQPHCLWWQLVTSAAMQMEFLLYFLIDFVKVRYKQSWKDLKRNLFSFAFNPGHFRGSQWISLSCLSTCWIFICMKETQSFSLTSCLNWLPACEEMWRCIT